MHRSSLSVVHIPSALFQSVMLNQINREMLLVFSGGNVPNQVAITDEYPEVSLS